MDDLAIDEPSELTLPMVDRLATHRLRDKDFLLLDIALGDDASEPSLNWEPNELKEDMELLNWSKPEQSSDMGGGGRPQLLDSARDMWRIWQAISKEFMVVLCCDKCLEQ